MIATLIISRSCQTVNFRYVRNVAATNPLKPRIGSATQCFASSAGGRPVHSDTNSISFGRIQPCCNYYAKTLYSYISAPNFIQVPINSFPLIPTETALCGSPFIRPLPPSSIAWPPTKTMCLDKSIHCAHKTMTLRTQTLSTTFTNSFCACQSSPFTDIRLICSVFVEFITSFFHVLTAAWQQWMLESDSELNFDGFVTVVWRKRTFCGSFGLRQRCGLT